MLTNFERRICYLANPKTASQTTALALRKFSGFLPVSDHHDGWDAGYGTRDVVEMGMDAEARTKWVFGPWAAYTYFHVVRNPFDTLASWFELSKTSIRFDKIGPEWFKAYKATHRHFPPEGLFPYVHRMPPGPLVTIKYEELGEALGNLASIFRFPAIEELPIIGATPVKHSDYRTYFDGESRAWVEDSFPLDIQAGGYRFD